MGRWKRHGVVVVLYSTDHDPRHVHVFEDRKRVLKFNIEAWTVMESELTAKAKEGPRSITERRHFMRNPRFREIKPNYRRSALEIILVEGRKAKKYHLPFAVFRDKKISSKNRFSAITIDRELGAQGASFVLEDGSRGAFPADFVLYYCDPTYDWSPMNQLKKALKDKLGASKLSVRVLADALNTSPSQVMRLLEENRASKQIAQLFRLAELAGYRVEFNLKKKKAA